MEQTNAEIPSLNTGESVSSAPVEKMLPQSKVDEIVKSVKHETAQKIHSQYQNQQQPTTQFDINEIKRLAAEEAKEAARQQHEEFMKKQAEEYRLQQGQRLAADFGAKLEAVKDKYPDLNVKEFPFGAFPHSVLVSSNFDNGADVMAELAKNPEKLDQLERLAERDPSLNLMHQAMKKVSDSIRINEQAKTVKTANEPLSQIKPSSISSDNGAPTLKDLKARYTW